MEESKDRKGVKHGGDVNLNCRFYRNQFPKIDDIVVVEVQRVENEGAYVSLLEYNNIEGMIPLGELSRKRIRSVTKLTRIGKTEYVTVIRVDEAKGYLDLSKKRVAPEEIQECENKFNKSKTVNSILRHVAQTTKTDIEILYETIGWPLYDKYEHAYDAFRMAVSDSNSVLEGLEMTQEVKNSLLSVIRSRLSPHPINIRADFGVTCFEYDGIDAIKEALSAGAAMASDRIQVKIRLIAAPVFVLVVTTIDRNQGMILANSVLRKIMEEIKSRGGNFVMKEEPHCLNDQGDLDIEEYIQKQNNAKHIEEGEEENDEGMDVDIGVDINAIDAKQELEEDVDEGEAEEEKGEA
ncbi:unnamed protein product [Blepharisma stoltei]|uniref:S1 motif domain-containing protein n=1 Tax=Blepharisma stoltei TaxID=1481888 RepID=A0AAU9KC48_9CILI|nr:unnamed protein product [Blepharisma stoltei]